MIQRHITAALQRSAAHYPVLCVTGPRQSGKTTLASDFFRNLEVVGALAKVPVGQRCLVFGGSGRQLRSNGLALGWKEALSGDWMSLS